MPRRGSRSSSHLSWLEPASSGVLSPMQLLVVWLTRHYATYANSTTKGEILRELCQGMRDAGYPTCTVHAIRSKIDSLRREARRERQESSRSLGTHRHSRAFQQYQQSLMAIFENEGVTTRDDTSDTETSNEEEADTTRAFDGDMNERHDIKSEPVVENGFMNTPLIVPEESESEGYLSRTRFRAERQRSLTVSEIRRRFELLCARHGLEQRGVALEIIDRLLPLPEE